MTVEQPNILIVCTDQQRFNWVGMNSEVPVQTPNLETLSNRGRWFRDAVSPAPVCNPARSCIVSGYEYDRCGVPNNEVNYAHDRGTLYRRLRDEAGYHVAACGKFDLTADYGLGMDGRTGVNSWGFSDAIFNPAKNETVSRVRAADGRPRGPYTQFLKDRELLETHVNDYERRTGENALHDGKLVTTEPTPLPDEAYYDQWITRNGRRLLDRGPEDKPWFLQVNFQNPHDPWDITKRMHELYRDPPVDFPDPTKGDGPVDSETHQAIRRNYAGMIEHLDSCLGELIEAVENRGDLGETLVVFMSDHGEMLGDYGQWQKDSPLHASVGVPLVVAGPGVIDADPCNVPVTTLDLHATVLDYAGIDAGDADSRSMRSLLNDRVSKHRDVVYSGLSTWRMVYDGRFKLVRGYEPERRKGTTYEPRGIEPAEVTRLIRDREPVLYDQQRGEGTNVADKHPEHVASLTAQLNEIRDRG